jgi:sugar phosphate isomerase/epimerase
MHPRISVNGMSTRTWGLAEDLAFYQAYGVARATFSFPKICGDPGGSIAAIGRSKVRPVLLAGNPATPLLGGLEILKAPVDAAHDLNCPTFYSVTGAAPDHMSTDDAYAALLKALAPVTAYARSRGVRIAIENNSVATRSHGFVHCLADAADLARDADLDICLELQNCWYERRLPQLFKDNVDRFAMVQISDFRLGEELRLNRRVPGDGSIPLEWMIERFLEAGYGGLFDIEILGPHVEAEGYAAAIGRSVDWLTERLVCWGV